MINLKSLVQEESIFELPFTCSLIASTRGGKSVFVKDLIKNVCEIEDIDLIIVKSLVYEVLDDYKLNFEGVLKLKKKKIKLHYSIYDQGKEGEPVILALLNKKKDKKNVVIILDDVISNHSKFDDSISQIFTRGRHSNISMIYSTQQASSLSTTMRQNSNFIGIFKQNTFNAKKFIIENIIQSINFKHGKTGIELYNDDEVNNSSDEFKIILCQRSDSLGTRSGPAAVGRRRGVSR